MLPKWRHGAGDLHDIQLVEHDSSFCDPFFVLISTFVKQVLIASAALVLLLGAALPGSAVFSKLNTYIYVIIVFSIVAMTLSLAVCCNPNEHRQIVGSQVLRANL